MKKYVRGSYNKKDRDKVYSKKITVMLNNQQYDYVTNIVKNENISYSVYFRNFLPKNN